MWGGSAQGNGHLWWSVINGPRLMAEKSALALLNGLPVVIQSSRGIPWRDEFINEVISGLSGKGYDYLPNVILPERSASLENALIWDTKLRNRYRQNSGLQEFLQEHGQLNDQLTYIQRPIDERRWLDFALNWKPRQLGGGQQGGMFVIEANKGALPAKYARKMQILDYDALADSYDVAAFSGMIFAGRAEEERRAITAGEKSYASTLASTVCGTDAELAGGFMERCDLGGDPIQTLRSLWGGEGAPLGHPFKELAEGNEKALNLRLWTAQVRILFPIIEIRRMSLIDQYRDEFRAGLDYCAEIGRPAVQWDQAQPTEQIIVKNEEDLEWGTIEYVSRANSIAVLDDVVFYKNCRNELAHFNPLAPDVVKRLLSEAR